MNQAHKITMEQLRAIRSRLRTGSCTPVDAAALAELLDAVSAHVYLFLIGDQPPNHQQAVKLAQSVHNILFTMTTQELRDLVKPDTSEYKNAALAATSPPVPSRNDNMYDALPNTLAPKGTKLS